MTSPNGMSFPEGMVILRAPGFDVESSQFVVAKMVDTNEATFTQFIWDAGRAFLQPLHPSFPTVEMANGLWLAGLSMPSCVDPRYRAMPSPSPTGSCAEICMGWSLTSNGQRSSYADSGAPERSRETLSNRNEALQEQRIKASLAIRTISSHSLVVTSSQYSRRSASKIAW